MKPDAELSIGRETVSELRATSYEDFDVARVNHLGLIQAVIARLGNNGFLIKGWTVTVAAALFGFAVESGTWQLALIAVFVALAFWALDAYFLRCERLFRELYGRVCTLEESLPPFFMAATSAEFATTVPADVADYWKIFRSSTLSYFFVPIMAAAILVVVIVLASPI